MIPIYSEFALHGISVDLKLTQGSMCFNTIHVQQLLLIRENLVLEI
jgi:hypothetical protein